MERLGARHHRRRFIDRSAGESPTLGGVGQSSRRDLALLLSVAGQVQHHNARDVECGDRRGLGDHSRTTLRHDRSG